jgi:hypothetical protein
MAYAIPLKEMGNKATKTAAAAPATTLKADYSVVVTNDMGHLTVKGGSAPNHIIAYVYQQAQRYLLTATDKDGLGVRYYCLRSGFKEKWVYRVGNETVLIHWDVGGAFDPATMRLV